ncbi:two component sensor kinase [Spirochaetia bacterium]|nr:two component sensor kinase [Spirochaetia bacterium]
MKQKKDERITVNRYFKDSVAIFCALVVVNGLHSAIMTSIQENANISIQFLINAMIGWLVFSALVLTLLFDLYRHYYLDRPMRRINEAARKIAKGDFSVRIAPLRKDGKKDFVEVMFDDFNAMTNELATIETLKTDFIASVSHEIKTPLSVIQNYVDVLQNDDLPVEQRREYTQTIMEATQKLSALTSNILKLNKLEHQEIIPEAAPYNVGEQIRRCALAFEELWERKHISLDADLDEIVVPYDESILEIVWNNLISNAIKFTPHGGSILLTAKAQDREPPGSEPPCGMAVITVQDSGCGMDRETQKRIFDKFYQGDTSHAQEGNGLGLALVKRAVELLGGTVSVDSEPGQGSTFTVSLKI